MKLERTLGCRVTRDEEHDFARVASRLGMSESQLMRWFVRHAIRLEQVIIEEAEQKGTAMSPEAFLASMDGNLVDWFRQAFFATNWIRKPEEIEAVGLKLLELARIFKESMRQGQQQ